METYKTDDIVLAAFLVTIGQPVIEIIMNGNKGLFCFESVDGNILEQFDLGCTTVEPRAFNTQIRQLTTACRRAAQRERSEY